MNKRILHLTLKKKWFDMIASGEKKEEYREIKPYWTRRLKDFLVQNPFDEIHFKNGYAKDAPFLRVECKGILFDTGVPSWGAEPVREYYVIKLGQILEIKTP